MSDVLHRMIALARELGELEKKLSDRDLTALRKLLNRAPVFPATALLLALDYLHGESCGTCSTERDQLHSFIVDAIVPGKNIIAEKTGAELFVPGTKYENLDFATAEIGPTYSFPQRDAPPCYCARRSTVPGTLHAPDCPAYPGSTL